MALNANDPRPARNADEARPAPRRASTALLVLSTAVLALVATVLVTWLAERPGLRARFDVTREHQNTLDPASLAVIEQLPEPLTLDVFFRAGEPPLQQTFSELHARLDQLLVLLRDARAGFIVIERHDVADRTNAGSKVENRMRELGLNEIESGGLLVVSAGERRAVLHVRGDLSDIDPGNNDPRLGPYVPPRILLFRGEEALVSALLKVSQGRQAKLLFSTGHGERDLTKSDMRGLQRLQAELEGDGFEVGTYQGERSGAIPADAAVLAILGAEQPFTHNEIASIQDYVASGGRLVVAPGFTPLKGEGSLVELLAPYGIVPVMDGLIARPLAAASGQPVVGVPQCGESIVWGEGMKSHPVTDPLRRANRRIHLPFSRCLERGNAPPGGTLLDVLHSEDDAWRDLPDPANATLYDWTPQPEEEKVKGRRPFVLAMAAAFAPSKAVPPERASQTDLRPESRIMCIGSADLFANELADTNRDFVLNVFNWAASREYRVNVRARDVQVRRLDVTSGSALASITFVAGALPALSLLLGVGIAWWRRRR